MEREREREREREKERENNLSVSSVGWAPYRDVRTEPCVSEQTSE